MNHFFTRNWKGHYCSRLGHATSLEGPEDQKEKMPGTLGFLILGLGLVNGASECRDPSISTCGECFARGPDCAWCSDPPTDKGMLFIKDKIAVKQHFIKIRLKLYSYK